MSLGIGDLASMDVRKNQSFHPILIHGVSSFSSGLPANRQSFFPGPHEGNRWLFRVCDRLVDKDNVMADFETLFSQDFERSLLNHLDCRTADDNQQYCDLMSVDSRYFQPSARSGSQNIRGVKGIAAQTADERDLKTIEAFNRSVENAFFNAARLEIISS